MNVEFDYLLCTLEHVICLDRNCEQVLVSVHERVRNRHDCRIVEGQ
jgi:hypothetical protein